MKVCHIDVDLGNNAATMSNAAFRQAMIDLNATLDLMAEVLGIARRLVTDYRKDKTIPRSVAMALDI